MKSKIAFVAVGVLALLLAGCSAEPETPAQQNSLTDSCMGALKKMEAQDTTLDKYLAQSYAYAIYPNVTTGAFIAGGAYGQGEVWQGHKLLGYTQISQGTVGAQVWRVDRLPEPGRSEPFPER